MRTLVPTQHQGGGAVGVPQVHRAPGIPSRNHSYRVPCGQLHSVSAASETKHFEDILWPFVISATVVVAHQFSGAPFQVVMRWGMRPSLWRG
jgi:hypothetical protein